MLQANAANVVLGEEAMSAEAFEEFCTVVGDRASKGLSLKGALALCSAVLPHALRTCGVVCSWLFVARPFPV